jgi:soluble lytic murein transglycosylase-like protein
MRKANLIILIFILFSYFTAGAPAKKVTYQQKAKKEVKQKKKKKKKGTYSFLLAVAKQESSNRHKVVNRFNMLGKYQFKWSTARIHLKKMKLKHITQKEFLNNPALQDMVMLANIKYNKKLLRKYIKKYKHRKIDGVYITESGILAGAHLSPGAVIEFFNRAGKYSMVDGNGTHVKTYIKKFANYELR